jgi:hypothetical protein
MPNVIGLLNAMDKSPLSSYQQKIKAHADSGAAPWLGDGMPTTGYQFSAQNSASADTNMEALRSGLLRKYGAGWFNMARDANQDTSIMTDDVRGMYEDSLQARAIHDAARQPTQQNQNVLQPFQMTQQYQNYMAGNYSQPQRSYQQPPMPQPRQQLQTFQSQATMPQTSGLLGYNQPAPQGNQYGLLNPYATSQR